MEKTYNPQEMDAAAVAAEQELIQYGADWGLEEISRWWSTWYLRAGHKRLGRLLVKIAKEERS
jgi:hypothetical protein